jgi:transposase InsO family protein
LIAIKASSVRVNRSGNVWDNAAMESFFSSLKTERTARKAYWSYSVWMLRSSRRAELSPQLEPDLKG